jgi:hypothetical protein
MPKDIIFFKIFDDVSDEYAPIPAKNCLPEWYKKTESYFDGRPELVSLRSKNKSIKKCMPVFDSITSGYIIKTYCDIEAVYEEGDYKFFFHSKLDVIQGHNKKQAEMYPSKIQDMLYIPKFVNPWGIKTTNGYSCIIVPPMHHDNPIVILPGIVDTDKYNEPIGLPFLFKESGKNVFIPAGTPIAQVIPFKRESWKSKISEDRSLYKKTNALVASLFIDGYKKLVWSKKDYK